jgi:hypothetical protein
MFFLGDSDEAYVPRVITVIAISGLAAAKGLQVKDLPAAVQKTVQDTLKGAAIRPSRKRWKG